jgi:hypothetical protein
MLNSIETSPAPASDADTTAQTQAKTAAEFDQAALDATMAAATKIAQGILQPMIIQNLKDTFKS